MIHVRCGHVRALAAKCQDLDTADPLPRRRYKYFLPSSLAMINPLASWHSENSELDVRRQTP